MSANNVIKELGRMTDHGTLNLPVVMNLDGKLIKGHLVIDSQISQRFPDRVMVRFREDH